MLISSVTFLDVVLCMGNDNEVFPDGDGVKLLYESALSSTLSTTDSSKIYIKHGVISAMYKRILLKILVMFYVLIIGLDLQNQYHLFVDI